MKYFVMNSQSVEYFTKNFAKNKEIFDEKNDIIK